MREEELATVDDAVELSQKLVRLHREPIVLALQEVGVERVSLLPSEDVVDYLLFLLHYIAESEDQPAEQVPSWRPACSVCKNLPCSSPEKCNAARKQARRTKRRKEPSEPEQPLLGRDGKREERSRLYQERRARRQERETVREKRELERLMKQPPRDQP